MCGRYRLSRRKQILEEQFYKTLKRFALCLNQLHPRLIMNLGKVFDMYTPETLKPALLEITDDPSPPRRRFRSGRAGFHA